MDIIIYYSSSNLTPPLTPPPPEFLHHLAQSIESEIIDRFWSSRCLNDLIDHPDMIGSFSIGSTASLVAKNGTRNIIILLWIKSSPVDRYRCLRCLNEHYDTNITMRPN